MIASERKPEQAPYVVELMKYFKAEKPREKRGVLVVTHGLNLNPTRMDELAAYFAGEGFEVFRPAFEGHEGENERYLSVTAVHWEADARRIHAAAAAHAKERGLPLFLLAYSFSALIFQSMESELAFAKRIYLAPALAMKFWYPLVKIFARLRPDFSYNSVNLANYLANTRSSARAFLALDAFVERWRGGRTVGDTPTLILADPGDELVSVKGLAKLVKKHPAWRLEKVSNHGSTMGRTFHHLIVNEASVGKREWARMTGMMGEFLLGED